MREDKNSSPRRPAQVPDLKLVVGQGGISTPEWDAYLASVGAVKVALRRGVVRIEHKQSDTGRTYYSEPAVIRANRVGKVDIYYGDADAAKIALPNADQQRAIETEFAAIKFPVPLITSLNNAEQQRRQLNIPTAKIEPANEHGFVHRKQWWFPIVEDASRDRVLYCIQRIDKPDGSKIYVPWTFYSDNEWHRGEPDIPPVEGYDPEKYNDVKTKNEEQERRFLKPFWKPLIKRNLPIMVHEGQKTAEYIDWLVNDSSAAAQMARDRHPYIDILKQYEHWGIAGGAKALQYADYDELIDYMTRLDWGIAVYVADRDRAGESAVTIVSKHYGKSLDYVRFDDDFAYGFDLADPLPVKFYNSDGRFKGQSFRSYFRPATFITEEIISDDADEAPTYKVRREFIEEWVSISKPSLFAHKRFPTILLNQTELNARLRPFMHIKINIAQYLTIFEEIKVDVPTFNPSTKSGITHNMRGELAFNTHVPSNIQPINGDPKPFLDYLTHLIPQKSDRYEVMRFVATFIDRPEIKMGYGLLLCSETQGVGKTTLGQDILAPIAGYQNVSYPSESDITNSHFTAWKANCRLIVVEEIYAGQSSLAYNRLKTLITDAMIHVDRKFEQPYDQDNFTAVIASSNSLRALKLPDGDRRWLVPKVIEVCKPIEFWQDLHRWLKGEGLGIIKNWAHQWLLEDESRVIRPGQHAPTTAAKNKMVEAGWSHGQQSAADLLEYLKKQSVKLDRQIIIVKRHPELPPLRHEELPPPLGS